MNQKITFLLLSFCLINVSILAQNKKFKMPTNVTEKDYMPNMLIAKVKSDFRNHCNESEINIAMVKQTLQNQGVVSVSKRFKNEKPPVEKYNKDGYPMVDLSLMYEIKFNDNQLVTKINQLLATNVFEYVEPKYIATVSDFNPNDPRAASGQQQYNYLNRIKMFQAWDLALGGSQGDTNVIIAIVDSGSDLDHPDLVGNIKINGNDLPNGIDDDNDGYIDNYRGWDLAGANYSNVVGDNNPNTTGANNAHGSHVSGCASATTNNGVGVAGIGFKCKFLPVKCAADNDTRAPGGAGYIISGYDGIKYSADHGAKVINCSWGGPGGGQAGEDIVNYAVINKDAVVVCAAGNNSLDEAIYPAAYSSAMSVVSCGTTSDLKSSFSNWNTSCDITAPGASIYNTYYNNTYASQSGTSMASPIVAGAAALVRSKYPTYSALQVVQRLKTTADNHYTSTNLTNYNGKLGSGRLNVFRALTDALSPAVDMFNKTVTDNNDNAFVIGDTLYMVGYFKNYLSATGSLTATTSVVTGATYVTSISNSATLGVLAMNQTANNVGTPFRYKINTGTPQNSTITFKVTITDGTYTNSFLYDVIVNVDYINININQVATTITSKGKIGYNQDAQAEGLGFAYNGTGLLYEGGLMIGSTSSAVSDCVRGATANTSDADFQSVIAVKRNNVNPRSDFDVNNTFNDNPASPQQKLLIKQNTYAWSSAPDDKYVILEYLIKNNGTSTLSNLYAGIFCDWDIDATTYASNKSDFDASTKMGYAYCTLAGGKYAGVKLLTNTAPVMHYSIDNVGGGGGGVDLTDATTYYSTAEKYTTLSTNRLQGGNTATAGNDIITVTGSGPFTITPGDSVKVAFAMIAGDNLTDIITSAGSAQVRYDGLLLGFEHSPSIYESKVFPNPADNTLHIAVNKELNEVISLEIYNSKGQVIHVQKSSDNLLTIDVSTYASALYMYKIIGTHKTATGKFLVK